MITTSKKATIARWALTGFAGLAMMAAASGARAQEAEPGDFTPAPDGTNVLLGYYVYGHQTDYSIARGPTVKNSGLEVNVALARYVHFDYIHDIPAGFQIIQEFGSLSGGHIDGTHLPNAFGAANITLSAFMWPYANVETKTYIGFAGFVNPPTGTYDKNSGLNVGAPNWTGDLQLFANKGIGDNISLDLGFDFRDFGDSTAPGGLRTRTDPDFRFQAWATYRFTPALSASLGYEGLLGGKVYTNDFFTGQKSEEQRLRGNVAMFLTPVFQVLLELNHDFVRVGGFKQDFGTTLRLLYVF
jgi:hypothetical protein